MGPSVLVWKNCHKFDVIKFTIPARIVQILQQRANVYINCSFSGRLAEVCRIALTCFLKAVTMESYYCLFRGERTPLNPCVSA